MDSEYLRVLLENFTLPEFKFDLTRACLVMIYQCQHSVIVKQWWLYSVTLIS